MKKQILLFSLFLALCINSCKKENTTTLPTQATPTITNVQPKNPSPGDVVTITGTGFGNIPTDVKVSIGSQVITITTVSDNEIKFTLPTGITAGDIAVAIKNIIANNTDPQKATITPQVPGGVVTITSINPTSGKAGDIVTIVGVNFATIATDNVVKFNGTTATVTGSVSSALTVTVPTGVTTGPVTVSVKGAAAITGPTFTVTTGSTGTGTAVPYIIANAGTATFSKITTAPAEIGAMIVDKTNNIMYYSDYSIYTANHPGTIYKLKLDGSAATVLSTDTKVTQVIALGVDATGNVYAVASLDALGGVQANILKIDAGTGATTSIAANVNYRASGGTLNIDSQGGVWVGYSQKYNAKTNAFDQNATLPYSSYHNASSQTDNIYVDNAPTSTDISFYKYNLITKTGTVTDFTLSSLFKQDDAAIQSNITGFGIQSRYAVDGNENFYAIYPINGTAANGYTETYVIRKTKNGNGVASTLISNFNNKQYSITSQVSYQNPRLNTGLIFQSDAAGNLYFKDNGTDIIKVTY